VLCAELAESQTLVYLAHQNRTTIGGDSRSLEIDFQRGVAGELKWLFWGLTRWVEAYAEPGLLPTLHEYRLWLDRAISHTKFKTEMWVKSPWIASMFGNCGASIANSGIERAGIHTGRLAVGGPRPFRRGQLVISTLLVGKPNWPAGYEISARE
jgi:hypothetical protein